VSRQVANKALQTLEGAGLLRLERGGIRVIDLAALGSYGG
jgi:DNA-binding GntR family transcriptional regulator